MKVTMYGDDLEGMARAVKDAIEYEAKIRSGDGTDKIKDMGIRREGVFFSIRFNKAGISVWQND